MNILLTGAAGFIGFHTALHLMELGHTVIGVDTLNNYYDPKLKEARLAKLAHPLFIFKKVDVTEHQELLALAKAYKVQVIIHLAAQPGVRYSLINPFAYTKNNVDGHMSVLEVCRKLPSFERLIYASSSSVYGANTKIPYSEDDMADRPVSLYAATKRSCEIISESYYNLFKLPMIGLRFFTVYGPWGRPDMAPFIFTKSIMESKPIELFNHGEMERDFTYIDDIVQGIVASMHSTKVNNRIYNLGNHKSEKLLDFVHTLERVIGKKAEIILKDIEPGDVMRTYADITRSAAELGFKPITNIEAGLKAFVDWYATYWSEQ